MVLDEFWYLRDMKLYNALSLEKSMRIEYLHTSYIIFKTHCYYCFVGGKIPKASFTLDFRIFT